MVIIEKIGKGKMNLIIMIKCGLLTQISAISYKAGWIVGFFAGTFGIYHEPTDEEIKANEIMREQITDWLEKFKKEEKTKSE